MRGSSLSNAKVVRALRPFIVVAWNGREVRDAPDEIWRVYRQVDRRRVRNNILLAILGSDGRVRSSFSPFPGPTPGSLGFDGNRQADYLVDQLGRATAGLRLPRELPVRRALCLPDVDDDGRGAIRGVRVFLTCHDPLSRAYRTPIVVAVAVDDRQRDRLEYPATPRSIDAGDLRGWLKELYPPAMMTRSGQVADLSGTLRFEAVRTRDAARRTAVLQGDVRLVLDDARRTRYSGRLALVIDYETDRPRPTSLRGVFRGVFPKRDLVRDRLHPITLTAAIGSRPR